MHRMCSFVFSQFRPVSFDWKIVTENGTVHMRRSYLQCSNGFCLVYTIHNIHGYGCAHTHSIPLKNIAQFILSVSHCVPYSCIRMFLTSRALIPFGWCNVDRMNGKIEKRKKKKIRRSCVCIICSMFIEIKLSGKQTMRCFFVYCISPLLLQIHLRFHFIWKRVVWYAFFIWLGVLFHFIGFLYA